MTSFDNRREPFGPRGLGVKYMLPDKEAEESSTLLTEAYERLRQSDPKRAEMLRWNYGIGSISLRELNEALGALIPETVIALGEEAREKAAKAWRPCVDPYENPCWNIL